MPKSDEAVINALLEAQELIFSFIVLDGICFLSILIILIILAFRLFFRNGPEHFDNIVMNWDFNEEPKETKLPRKFSVACVLCLIVYIFIYGLEFIYFFFIAQENIPTELTSTQNTINSIEGWLKQNQEFGTSVALIDLMHYILFIITKFLLFVIFIGRIWHSFKGTHYQSKKTLYKTLIICIPIVIVLMMISEAVAYILDINADHNGVGLTGVLSGIVEMVIIFCIVIVLDAVITVIVIVLYFTKLKALILTKQRTNRMISGAEIEMNETQTVFVNKAVKHALLCFITFSMTQIVWYYSLITFWINGFLLWSVTYYAIIGNGLFTSICIFFTYKFNDNSYYRCCKKCHFCLFNFCRKKANATLAANPVAM
eukprot:161533_1